MTVFAESTLGIVTVHAPVVTLTESGTIPHSETPTSMQEFVVILELVNVAGVVEDVESVTDVSK